MSGWDLINEVIGPSFTGAVCCYGGPFAVLGFYVVLRVTRRRR